MPTPTAPTHAAPVRFVGAFFHAFLCVFLVCALAKALTVALRGTDGATILPFLSPTGLAAMLYQDCGFSAAAAAILATLSMARSLRWISVILYLSATIWIAVNIPVARVMSAPLTASMLGTAGTALLDSILVYVTWDNLAAIASVIAASILLWRHIPSVRSFKVAASMALVFGLLGFSGPFAVFHVETLGLHRNAVLSMATTSMARLRLWQPEPVPNGPNLPADEHPLDLTQYRGAAKGRHVVWVVLESIGAQYLGLHGHSPDPMPRLAELAHQGLVFDNAYSAYPESIKSLFSSLCGDSPSPHTPAESYSRAKLPESCLPDVFQAARYRTGLFHSGRFAYLGMEDVLRDRSFDVLKDAATIESQHTSSFGCDDMATTRATLAFIDETLAQNKPFFAVYMPISGHHPYRSPGTGTRPFPENTELDAYLNDVHMADEAMGALFDGLKQRGLWDNTLIVVVSDHAEAFFQHEGNFAHSLYLYEENVWVPMVFAIPGVVTRRTRAPQIASLVDVAATMTDLMDLPVPERSTGFSLLGGGGGAARFLTDHGLLQAGLRHGSWKFILEMDTNRARLFQFPQDRAEKNNLAEKYPERVELYRRDLMAWMAYLKSRVSAKLIIKRPAQR